MATRRKKNQPSMLKGLLKVAVGSSMIAAGKTIEHTTSPVAANLPHNKTYSRATIRTTVRRGATTTTATVHYDNRPSKAERVAAPKLTKKQRLILELSTWTTEDERLSGLHHDQSEDAELTERTWLQTVTRPIEPHEQIYRSYDGDELTGILRANLGGYKTLLVLIAFLPVMIMPYLVIKYIQLVRRLVIVRRKNYDEDTVCVDAPTNDSSGSHSLPMRRARRSRIARPTRSFIRRP